MSGTSTASYLSVCSFGISSGLLGSRTPKKSKLSQMKKMSINNRKDISTQSIKGGWRLKKIVEIMKFDLTTCIYNWHETPELRSNFSRRFCSFNTNL